MTKKKSYTINLDEMSVKELLDHLINWRSQFEMANVEIRETNKKDYAILALDELFRRFDYLIKKVDKLEEKLK